MTAVLPYLASPGSLKTCLEKIKAAATPDRVTTDFVTTKLQIKGGTGAALIPYLKKIGFVASDGSPTDIYKQFRNSSTAGISAARAAKHGYKELERVNEYFYGVVDCSGHMRARSSSNLIPPEDADGYRVDLTISKARAIGEVEVEVGEVDPLSYGLVIGGRFKNLDDLEGSPVQDTSSGTSGY